MEKEGLDSAINYQRSHGVTHSLQIFKTWKCVGMRDEGQGQEDARGINSGMQKYATSHLQFTTTTDGQMKKAKTYLQFTTKT